MSKFVNLLLLCFVVISTTACGDLFMKNDDKDNKYNQFSTCDFDVDSVSKIMTKKIKGDLLCLEHNLYLFIDLVESDKPGFLPKEALTVYMKENIENVSDKTLQIMSAVFDLNSILLGDDANYISKESIEKLADILIDFNSLIVDGQVYELFNSNEEISFSEHNKRKSIIFNALVKIGELFSASYIKNNNQIDITDFVEKFRDVENVDILKNVDALLFLKKAFLGGSESKLTGKELRRLSTMISDIGRVTFDFLKISTTKTDDEEKIFGMLKEDIETAQSQFYYKKSKTEVVVTYKQLVKVVDLFFPEYSKFLKYKKSILKVKKILLGSETEEFKAPEINTLLSDFLLEHISRGIFVYRSYVSNLSVFEKSKKIWNKFLNLVTFNDSEDEYINDFNRIVTNYRYYQGSAFSPKFNFDYNRNPRGLFDIMLYEDLAQKFFKHYRSDEAKEEDKYVLSQERVVVFLEDFKEILVGEGYVLPGRGKNSAETITLMTNLFHNQSNGDSEIEIYEFVEFAITLTTSLNLSTEMYSFMKKECEVDSKQRVTPACYRENFSRFLEYQVSNGSKVHEFVPGLLKYLHGMVDQDEVDRFLQASSKFSRLCNVYTDGSEVPMKYGDFFVSWAGLLAVEQSMLRWDTDKSGILEPRNKNNKNEIEAAFKVYKNAIKGMVPVERLKTDWVANKLFLYLIKFKRVPDIPTVNSWRSFWRAVREGFSFVNFLRKYNTQDATADRMTFAAVLKIIAENSPANKENPYPCDTLRL